MKPFSGIEPVAIVGDEARQRPSAKAVSNAVQCVHGDWESHRGGQLEPMLIGLERGVRSPLDYWPRSLINHRLENGKISFTDKAPSYSTLRIDDNGSRQLATVELCSERALGIPQNGVVDPACLHGANHLGTSICHRVLPVIGCA